MPQNVNIKVYSWPKKKQLTKKFKHKVAETTVKVIWKNGNLGVEALFAEKYCGTCPEAPEQQKGIFL